MKPNISQINEGGWIILEAGTGLMDGVYTKREMAWEQLKYMHEKFPSHDHLLVHVESGLRGKNTGDWIPDKSFHAMQTSTV